MESIRKKLVVVGDAFSGKSSMLQVSRNEIFPRYYSDTAFENFALQIDLDGQAVELAIWDTAGLPDYNFLRHLAYPKTDVVIICYSIDNPISFENVTEKWLPEVQHFCSPEVPILLVGNKMELREDLNTLQVLKAKKMKPVTQFQGQSMAEKIKAWAYLECSAANSEGVTDVIQAAALAAMSKHEDVEKDWKCGCVLI